MISLPRRLLPAAALLLTAATLPAAVRAEESAAPAPAAAPAPKAAEMPDIPSEAEWRAQRDTLMQEVIARVQKEATAAVSEEAVAKELKFGWPVKEPTLTVQGIQDDADRDAQAAAKAKYPDAAKTKFFQAAEAQYKLHAIGENVRINLRQGAGTHTEVSGRLLSVSSELIRIGDRRLAPRDIDDEVLATLDPDTRAAAVERLANRKWKMYLVERESFRQDRFQKLENERMTAAGFRLVKRGKGRSAEWVPARTLLNQELERRVRKTVKELFLKLEPEMYGAAGFVRDEKNEWIPKVVLEDRKSKAAAAGQAPAAPAPGAPPAAGMPTGPLPPWAQGQKMPPGMPPGGMPPGMMMPPNMMPPGAPAAKPAENAAPPPWSKPAAPAPAAAKPAAAPAAKPATPAATGKPAGSDKNTDFFN
ncbi:MAG: hypothetical protein WC708_11590 [Lentisphaeria bacterium]